MKEKITDVFFDLDHTLWDFEKNSALTYKKILMHHEVAVSLEKFLEVYIPLNLAYWKLYREEKISKEQLRYQRLRNTFDKLDFSIDDSLILKLSEAYVEELPNQNFLFQNSIEILDYLKTTYRLHIITNGFKEVQHGKLKNSNIIDFFTHVVNSEMVGVKKPNPKIFNFALEKAGVPASQAIMIGDNLEADILGAQNAGMQALHFNSNNEAYHEHCIIINDLIEIKQYL